jgi:hypothetical protein
MNERIQELWSQAEEEIKAEYEDESRRNRRLYNEIFLPKFAELIVKECVELCETAAYAPRPALNPTPVEQYAFIIGEGNMAVNLAKQIRKHFGD